MLYFEPAQGLPAGKSKRFKACVEELNIESLISNIAVLSNELVEMLFSNDAAPIDVGIAAMVDSGRLAIQEDPKLNGFASGGRAVHQMQITCKETKHAVTRRRLKHEVFSAYGPFVH
jgi:hypothetical protein